MEEVNNVETLKLAIWIAGIVISLLLAVVVFFLRKQISVSETLTMAVNNLTTAVEVIKTQQSERDPRTEKRLNDHARRLKEHGERIVVVEDRLSIGRGKKQEGDSE